MQWDKKKRAPRRERPFLRANNIPRRPSLNNKVTKTVWQKRKNNHLKTDVLYKEGMRYLAAAVGDERHGEVDVADAARQIEAFPGFF